MLLECCQFYNVFQMTEIFNYFYKCRLCLRGKSKSSQFIEIDHVLLQQIEELIGEVTKFYMKFIFF